MFCQVNPKVLVHIESITAHLLSRVSKFLKPAKLRKNLFRWKLSLHMIKETSVRGTWTVKVAGLELNFSVEHHTKTTYAFIFFL